MKRFSLPRPGTVLGAIAIVIALSGTAVAAKRYVITSSKQIAPKVRKQLTGKQGPAGLPGKTGPQGAPGAPGRDGTNGSNGTNGATGARGPSDVHVSFFD